MADKLVTGLLITVFIASTAHAQEAPKPKPGAEEAKEVQKPQTGTGLRIEVKPQAALEPTAAIPVFKIRQGEKFKLFDGIGGGLKWTPFYKQNVSSFTVAALVLLSSTTQVDKNDPSNKDQVNVMSVGLVLGYDWFQIGFGRDMRTSESKETFDSKSKNFMMLNLSGKITF